MVARYHRKQSKRMPARRRYKVEKKVRQHNKKLRREAKKNPQQKKKKKDLGVPNSLPFKEQILLEAEDRKKRAEEMRQRQKEERQKLVAEKRKMNMEQLAQEAASKVAQFENKQRVEKSLTKNAMLSERSAKTYYREFRKVVEAADVVLEVLDARDPFGSRCPQVEQAVLDCGTKKRLVLVLNKIDLIPKDNLEKWLKYLRNELPTIAFKASTQAQNNNLSQSKVPIHKSTDGLMKTNTCLGADMLMKLLGNYCRNNGVKTSIRVGIVGFPNVGKSSIINSLKRSKACNVGATPGVTRTMQEVQLDKHIVLLDSPGVVMATGPSVSAVALRNAIKVETLEDPVAPVEAILQQVNRNKLLMYYRIPDFSSVHDFLCLLARRQGRLKKGGVPDTDAAARVLLGHWNTGRIKYYTEPPEVHTMSTHISSTIVQQMSAEFDIDSLITDEAKVLQDFKPTCGDSALVVTSAGLTEGHGEGVEEEMEVEPAPEPSTSTDMLSAQVNVSMPESVAPSGLSSPVSKLEKSRNKKMKNKTVHFADEGNLQLNKERKDAFKKMKKSRKRSDKLAGKLADGLMSAMNMSDADDSYSFDTDYK